MNQLIAREACRLQQLLGARPLQDLSVSLIIVKLLVMKGAAEVCKCCGAGNAPMKCALCLSVYYCSPECQKKDWKEGGENRHKIQCAALTEARARYMEKAKREIKEKMTRFGLQESIYSYRRSTTRLNAGSQGISRDLKGS